MELLFRGTRDGMNSRNFHEKYDNKGPTITLLRNDKGNIMGGFSPISWTVKKDIPLRNFGFKKFFVYYFLSEIFEKRIIINI